MILIANVRHYRRRFSQLEPIIIKSRGHHRWKFVSENNTIDVETGLYFGKKDFYSENRNIFISGEIKNEMQIINWELRKI